MSHEHLQVYIYLLKAAVEYEIANIKSTSCKQRRKKRIWTRKWILRRDELGASARLMKELANEDALSYHNIVRISNQKFDELLLLVEPAIQTQNTHLHMALSARLILEILLRFLASGDSFKTLSYLFRVPVCSISIFLPQVLTAIIEALSVYMKFPTTSEEWKNISKIFHRNWNFSRCCGSMDGKHITIKRPAKSGSQFYNYKGFYSIILFAVVDSEYCFTYLDIGSNGRAGDGAVFKASSLNEVLIRSEVIGLPPDHVFIGDSAFPLQTNLMKPYAHNTTDIKQKIFNYRLSRARRVVENAFGILAWCFRVFLRPIEVLPSTVDKLVWAACSLHNWLQKTNVKEYISHQSVDREDPVTGEVIPGLWREFTEGILSVSQTGSNNYRQEAEAVRKTFSNYFYNEGSILWQWAKCGLQIPHGLEDLQSDNEDEM